MVWALQLFQGSSLQIPPDCLKLTPLTRKDCAWKAGPLPDVALKAFWELQLALSAEPVLAYPRWRLQYALATKASVGEEDHSGGLGAILSQIDEEGNHHTIGYARWRFTNFEKNCSPFLLEMQAVLWAYNIFNTISRVDHYSYLQFTSPSRDWENQVKPTVIQPQLILPRRSLRLKNVSAQNFNSSGGAESSRKFNQPKWTGGEMGFSSQEAQTRANRCWRIPVRLDRAQ